MTRTRYLPLAPLVLLSACGTDPQETLNAVRMTEEAVAQAIAADDLDGIVRSYEDNAVFVVSDGAPEVGKAAIRASFERMLANPTLKMELKPETAWAAKSGELAVTTGTLTFTTTKENGDPYTVRMKNQTVWRRDDGVGWKIASDYNVAEPESETEA